MEQLPNLRGCEAHSSVMLSSVDTNIFKRLGVHLTCEPVSENKKIYYKYVKNEDIYTIFVFIITIYYLKKLKYLF